MGDAQRRTRGAKYSSRKAARSRAAWVCSTSTISSSGDLIVADRTLLLFLHRLRNVADTGEGNGRRCCQENWPMGLGRKGGGSPAWIRTTITTTYAKSVSCRLFNGLKCRIGPKNRHSYTTRTRARVLFYLGSGCDRQISIPSTRPIISPKRIGDSSYRDAVLTVPSCTFWGHLGRRFAAVEFPSRISKAFNNSRDFVYDAQ